jgi:hypothetical protein
VRERVGSKTVAGLLVKGLLKDHPAFSANPVGDWAELAGEQVARYSQPRTLKKKVLTIVAHDSVWKHHLEQFKEGLIELINRGRTEPLVEEIAIRVGDLPQAPPNMNPQSRKLDKLKSKRAAGRRKAKVPTRELTPEEQALIKSLPDPELRSLGKKLLRRMPLE